MPERYIGDVGIDELHNEHAIKVSSNENVYNIGLDESNSYNVTLDESIVINVITDVPKYEGDYIVTPRAHEEVVLDTDNKLMTDDVTVLEIPYYETSNLSGTTVYIG